MVPGPLDRVLRNTLLHLQGADALTDAQLLERFNLYRDQAAFALVVRRHGPMVLRVCQRLLGDAHAAEDAFQAAFIVLARKAAHLARPNAAKHSSVGGWLHKVAWQVAARARRYALRRQVHEKHFDGAPSEEPVAPALDPESSDLRPLLDEELLRLPEKYRQPLVLCYLQGKTHEEAARQLHWPTGTVKVRLVRGRELLRDRLTRRGAALSLALLNAHLSRETASAAVPATLLTPTVEGITRLVEGNAPSLSAQALALADSTLKSGALARRGLALGILLLLGISATGFLMVSPPAAPQSVTVPGRAAGIGPLVLPSEPKQVVWKTAFLRDGKALAVACNYSVVVWDLEKEEKLAVFRNPKVAAVSLAVSPNDRWLAAGGLNGQVAIWDLVTGRELATLQHAERLCVADLAFTPDSGNLVGAGGKRLQVWSLPAVERSVIAAGHTERIDCIAVAPDGKTFASRAQDRTIRQWDTATGGQSAGVRFKGPTVYFGVNGLTYTPGGQLLTWLEMPGPSSGLLAGPGHGRLAIVDWHKDEIGPEESLVTSPGLNTIFAPRLVSPSARMFAALDEKSKRLVVWDLATKKPLHSLDVAHMSRATLEFSADEKSLAVGGVGSVTVWRLEKQ